MGKIIQIVVQPSSFFGLSRTTINTLKNNLIWQMNQKTLDHHWNTRQHLLVEIKNLGQKKRDSISFWPWEDNLHTIYATKNALQSWRETVCCCNRPAENRHQFSFQSRTCRSDSRFRTNIMRCSSTCINWYVNVLDMNVQKINKKILYMKLTIYILHPI